MVLTRSPRIASLLILILLACVSWTSAEETVFYDRINLSAEATDSIENDTLVAILFAQREGPELAKLSNEVNLAISRAVQRSKQVAEVQVQTQAYQTYPVYQKQTQTGWRVRQAIQLESQATLALSELIGQLQSTLAVESLSYRVSTEKRLQMEEQLIGRAIQAFQQRARNISTQLGRKQYRLVTMHINTAGSPVQPVMREFAIAADAKVAAPNITPGKQSMTVTVNGTIELGAN